MIYSISEADALVTSSFNFNEKKRVIFKRLHLNCFLTVEWNIVKLYVFRNDNRTIFEAYASEMQEYLEEMLQVTDISVQLSI